MIALKAKVQSLLRLVATAIEPYRGEVVLFGGIAKHWYQVCEGFVDSGLVPNATLDIDLALPEPMFLRGEVSLHQRLIDQQLTMWEIPGLDNRTAVCRYYLPGTTKPKADDPYLECLVPLRGRERTTPGIPQGPPLVASPVRFLDLLVHDAMALSMPDIGTFRVPHPLAYIFQKTRIRLDRRPTKQVNDQADIFYVMLSLQSRWQTWRSQWESWQAHSTEWTAWLKTTDRLWKDLYAIDGNLFKNKKHLTL
jgi:hypothetical protein